MFDSWGIHHGGATKTIILMTMGFREGDKVINIEIDSSMDRSTSSEEISVGWRPKASWLENVLLYNHIVQGGCAKV